VSGVGTQIRNYVRLGEIRRIAGSVKATAAPHGQDFFVGNRSNARRSGVESRDLGQVGIEADYPETFLVGGDRQRLTT